LPFPAAQEKMVEEAMDPERRKRGGGNEPPNKEKSE
jgi:hypothetical protein